MVGREASGDDNYPLGPALEFLRQMSGLNHALERLSSRMERTLGITAQQRLIIRCIGKYPGITGGQLATLLHLDPGTISASLRRLSAKRLLARRVDPRDKRRSALELTARGRAIDRPTRGTVEHAVERLLDQVGAADIATTRSVLAQLSGLVESTANRSRVAKSLRSNAAGASR
jgi:DNA-binding MarR family transcriptional regulator